MKNILIFGALALAFVCLWGCADSNEPLTPARHHWSLQINMDADTLNFLPGDSARTIAWAVLRDEHGEVVPNECLHLRLSADCAVLELRDTARRDTTDTSGRVRFGVRMVRDSCVADLISSFDDTTITIPIYVRRGPTPVCAGLTVTPSGFDYVPDVLDSALVEIVVVDTNAAPLPNVQVRLGASGGRLDTIGRTDINGYASTYWYSDYQFGSYLIYSRYPLCDTARVEYSNVASPPLRYSLPERSRM
jgi:hypothetical protein